MKKLYLFLFIVLFANSSFSQKPEFHYVINLSSTPQSGIYSYQGLVNNSYLKVRGLSPSHCTVEYGDYSYNYVGTLPIPSDFYLVTDVFHAESNSTNPYGMKVIEIVRWFNGTYAQIIVRFKPYTSSW